MTRNRDHHEVFRMKSARTQHRWKNDDGSWNRSSIMRRGHDIASNMGENRAYSNRLSIGMRRAWKEARQASHETEEARIEDQRAGFFDRLKTWREEVRKDVDGSMPPAFSKHQGESDEPIEARTPVWEITAQKKGDRWSLWLGRKTVKERGVDDVATLSFKSRSAVEAAVEHIERALADETDLLALTEKLFAAIKPEVYDYQAAEIARRKDRDYANHGGQMPEEVVDEYTEHWICN